MESQQKIFKFNPNDLDFESRHIFHWHVFVPDGVEFKEIMRPEAWANIAHKLRPMARIHVTSESNKYIGELVVISCGNLWANVAEVFYREFGEQAKIDANDEYEIKWINNRYKFGIFRKSDGEIMEKELQDQVAANTALANHIAGARKVG